MIINLVVTAHQQLRAWLNEDLLKELERENVVNIWAPKKLKNSVKNSTSRHINLYSFEEDQSLSSLHTICLNINHKSSLTFRRLILESFFWNKTSRYQGLIQKTRAYARQIARSKTLLNLLIFKRLRKKIQDTINSKIVQTKIDFTPSDINIVVSSNSDLFHEIVIENLVKTKKPLIQVMENWDNISSKVCPSDKADALVVWSQQTRRHASDIHGFPFEKIHVLGSSRLNNQPFQKLRNELTLRETKANSNIKLFYPGFGGSHETLDYFIDMLNDINGEKDTFNLVFRPHPLLQNKLDSDCNQKIPELLKRDSPKTNQEVDPIWPILDPAIYTEMIDADVVIGTPSTFLLEAMLLKKKIILDYRKLNSEHSPRTLFESRTHFIEIVESNRIPKLRKIEDLEKLVGDVLKSDQDYEDLLKDLIVEPEKTFSISLRDLVLSVVGENLQGESGLSQ